MILILFTKRIFLILLVVFKYALLRTHMTEDGKKIRLKNPLRCRLILQELGGVFTKFGQILAMLFDLLPLAYATELLHLLDNTGSIPNKELFALFKKETGRSMGEVFETIDEKPLATASFGQVYRGRYNGAEIVIKIQKPEVETLIRADMVILWLFAPLVEATGILHAISIYEVLAQLKEWFQSELDYRVEAQNAETIGKHANQHKLTEVSIPKIYPEFTTKKIIVEEFLPGIQIKKLFGSLQEQPVKTEEFLKQQDINLKEVADFFVRDLMRQYFIDKFFHADPHPANLMVFPNNKVGYLDFGIIGRPSYENFDLLRFIDGVSRADHDEAADGIVSFAEQRFRKEIGDTLGKDETVSAVYKKTLQFIKKRVTKDLRPILNEWYSATGDITAPMYDRSSAITFFKMVRVLQKYRIKFPPDVIAFIRTLVIVDMVCLKLSKDFNMVTAIRTFFEKTPTAKVPGLAAQHAREMSDLHDFDKFLEIEKATKDGITAKKFIQEEKQYYAKEKFMIIVGALAEKYPELYNDIKYII